MWRVWRRGVLAAHVLLVPFWWVAREVDLARRPLGDGVWPGEPGWPAGSGSAEWLPGQLPTVLAVLLLWLVVLPVSALVTAAVSAAVARCR